MSRWFNSLSLRTKLIGTFVILLVLGSIATAWNLINLLQLNDQIADIAHEGQMLTELQAIQVNFLEQMLVEKDFLLTGDRQPLETRAGYQANIDQQIDNSLAMANNEHESEALGHLREEKALYDAAFTKVVDEYNGANMDMVIQRSLTESSDARRNVSELVEEWVVVSSETVEAEEAQADSQVQNSIIVSAVSLLVFLVVGIGVVRLAQTIVQPIREITDAAAAVEAGAFDPDTLSPLTERIDEIGRLARVFQHMAREVYAREQRMKQQIESLKIEIDEVKKQQQVSEIVDSEYFQDLKAKAKNMRGTKPGS